MSVVLSIEAEEYLEKKNISHIIVDVEKIFEPCLQAYNPRVKIMKNDMFKESGIFKEIAIGNYIISISDDFFKIFGSVDSLQLKIECKRKKKLSIGNIEPIIRNTCKIY